MTVTRFPHGLSTFGVPILPCVDGGAIAGRVFWVGSAAGVDWVAGVNAPECGDKETPFATIDYAIGKCTANNGDVIYVLPSHNETIVAATSLVLDVAGVAIIGLGIGNTRPILDFDNTAGSIELDAADCRFSNIILRASVSAVVVAINVDANNIEIDHLLFTYEETLDDFVTMMDVDAVSGFDIHDNIFRTEYATAGAAKAIRMDTANQGLIRENIFSGNWSDTVIFQAGAASLGTDLINNIIYNDDTGVYNCIDFGGLASTGNAVGNRLTGLYTTTAVKVIRSTANAMTWHENTICNSALERATRLYPATSSV